jgi:hypothetical protein
VVARHLIPCNWSTDPNFSLVLSLDGASMEAEEASKGGSEVEANISSITPQF